MEAGGLSGRGFQVDLEAAAFLPAGARRMSAPRAQHVSPALKSLQRLLSSPQKNPKSSLPPAPSHSLGPDSPHAHLHSGTPCFFSPATLALLCVVALNLDLWETGGFGRLGSLLAALGLWASDLVASVSSSVKWAQGCCRIQQELSTGLVRGWNWGDLHSDRVPWTWAWRVTYTQ